MSVSTGVLYEPRWFPHEPVGHQRGFSYVGEIKVPEGSSRHIITTPCHRWQVMKFGVSCQAQLGRLKACLSCDGNELWTAFDELPVGHGIYLNPQPDFCDKELAIAFEAPRAMKVGFAIAIRNLDE